MRLSTISWSSIVAGSIIATLAYLVFNVIWLAFGLDLPLVSLMTTLISSQGTSFDIGMATLFVFTVAASLFTGAYFACKVAPIVSSRHEVGHALLITAIFFAVFPVPALINPGALLPGPNGPPGLRRQLIRGSGLGLGDITEMLGSPSQAPSIQPEVFQGVSQALDGRPYRQDLPQVTTLVIGFLDRLDTQAAARFLIGEGLPPGEADLRVQSAKLAYDTQVRIVKAKARGEVSAVAWAFLMTLALGTVAAILGAAIGVRTAEVASELGREEVSRAA